MKYTSTRVIIQRLELHILKLEIVCALEGASISCIISNNNNNMLTNQAISCKDNPYLVNVLIPVRPMNSGARQTMSRQ